MSAGKGESIVRRAIGALAGEFQRLARPLRNSWLNSFRYELPRKEYIVRNAAKVIAFNEHDKGILLENGLPDEKIAVIPQGLSDTMLPQLRENATTMRTGCLRVGYIGRATEIKGCHLLLDAMKLMPADAQMELHVYGCDESTQYVERLHQMAGGDHRIIFHSVMAAVDVLKEYAQLDVLCIPSIVFETGPLTLLEGIYSGCRVYGSTQIGQMETLKEYGEVVYDNVPSAWSAVFQKSLQNLNMIRNNRPTHFIYRTMKAVAKELFDLM